MKGSNAPMTYPVYLALQLALWLDWAVAGGTVQVIAMYVLFLWNMGRVDLWMRDSSRFLSNP
jgi:hypothetical protein